MNARCGCGRRWTGLAEAHCACCHAHFSTVSNFDRHAPRVGGCRSPESVGLVPHDGPNGVTYRMPGRTPEPQAAAPTPPKHVAACSKP